MASAGRSRMQCAELPVGTPGDPERIVVHGHIVGRARIVARGLEIGDGAEGTRAVDEAGVSRGAGAVVAHGVTGAAVADAVALVTQIVRRPGVYAGAGEIGAA